jgi:hypothetical protein
MGALSTNKCKTTPGEYGAAQTLTIHDLDVHGSVHHSIIYKEKSNMMQQCIKILLFHTYMKLNMFRATHRSSSGA